MAINVNRMISTLHHHHSSSTSSSSSEDNDSSDSDSDATIQVLSKQPSEKHKQINRNRVRNNHQRHRKQNNKKYNNRRSSSNLNHNHKHRPILYCFVCLFTLCIATQLFRYIQYKYKISKSKSKHHNSKPYQGEQFLIYQCNSNCGGFADRWKGAVAVYSQAKRTKRTFRIVWKHDKINLKNMFDSKLFDTDYLSHSICRAKKYRNTVSLMGEAINQRQFDRASNPCLRIQTNLIPTWMSEQERNQLSMELWKMLIPKPHLQRRFNALPANIDACLQLRLGSKGSFRESHSFLSKEILFDLRAKIIQRITTGIIDKNESVFHLWSDSEIEKRLFEQNVKNLGGKIVHINGPLQHVDKEQISVDGLRRVVLEFWLISNCNWISWQTGYIKSGLFLAKDGVHIEKAENKICNGC